MNRAVWTLAPLALTAGCGVAGAPRPLTPGPPAPPTAIQAVRLIGGWRIEFDPPSRSVSGDPLPSPPSVAAWTDRPPGVGAPDATAPPGEPIRMTVSDDRPRTVWLAAVGGDRLGPPSKPVRLTWSPPPPPPEAPLAFVDASGAVQLTWLPPPPPIERVEVRRDRVTLGIVDAGIAVFSDPSPSLPARYTLVGLGADFRTASSSPAEVAAAPSAPTQAPLLSPSPPEARPNPPGE